MRSHVRSNAIRDNADDMRQELTSQQHLLALRPLAKALGVPASWLRAEALAGRIPSLRVGRRLRFNAQAVEQALLRRAAGRGKDRPKPIEVGLPERATERVADD